jgi:hypothetical protein
LNLSEYVPREIFLPLHNRKARWAVVVAHRRAGKTVAMTVDLVIGALECKLPKPQFAYLAPQRDQAKRVAWSYLKDLTKDFWSKPPNESELKVTINNGHGEQSTIFVAGADNYDALRGMYFDGAVLDEVGDMRPSAWYRVVRPALSDRAGWAIFAGTPSGKNLFWALREEARINPATHLLIELPITATDVLPAEEVAAARAQMTEEAFATEYMCSFEASLPGAYWAKQIAQAYEEQRVGEHKIDKAFPIHLVADLGYTDSCSWWGWQETFDGLRIVEFYEADGQPIQHYIDWIHERPYAVGDVWLPHDARAKSLQTGKSIIEQFLNAGIRPNLVPELSLQDGIEAARLILPDCYFDEGTTYEGIQHLRAYQREYDERTQTYRSRPKHDAHSHAADAFRYLALAARKKTVRAARDAHKPLLQPLARYNFALDDIWDLTDAHDERRVG